MFMGANEIREKYLSFFESKEHLRLPSFSLIPKNDKSLLLINAGMAPLKQYFLGIEKPPKSRITTCQKCIRTPDIDRVGKTARHATFFEMLGNFSFGDYFKKEAISWAWEFVTEILRLPKDRLWITIYEEDDEAFDIWHKAIGIEEERIVRMGKEDNFWEIGTGPCGPCSEIYYDRGVGKGCGKDTCKIGCDCDRFVEFWNLVFTQFDKDEEGNYHRLKNPNIDTGMGLERIAAIMQEVDSLFDIDTVKYIRDNVCKIAQIEYGVDKTKDVSIRVITDHIRGSVFMISDGILPSNEGRGYVLRRLIRRAARHGKLLGIKNVFLHEIVDSVVKMFGEAYPELKLREEYIKKVLYNEESKFIKTIDIGLELLDEQIDKIKNSHVKVLNGEVAFKLYDTFGFPIDLTKEICAENGILVDEEVFNNLMNEQKNRARLARKDTESEGWKETSINIDNNVSTEFIGYDFLECSAEVLQMFSQDEEISYINQTGQIVAIFDKTPFYAESGGQVADRGEIYNNKFKGEVYNVQKGPNGVFLHYINVIKGDLQVGDVANLKVDKIYRDNIMKNHTATHLLHKALRLILGDHVAQSGSLVESERLRFDFSHFEPLTKSQLIEVEKIINSKIMECIPVDIQIMKLDQAIKIGATALFDEKYSEDVRVVKISDFSMELCGGTHVKNTGQIGVFKIISEGSVSAGVRRIEAITGVNVYNYLNELETNLDNIKITVKANTYQDIIPKIKNIENSMKDIIQELNSYKQNEINRFVELVLKNKISIEQFNLYMIKTDNIDVENAKIIIDKIKEKDSNAITCIIIKTHDMVNFIISCTKEGVKKGINCGQILREACMVVGGKGGGRPDFAQGGCKNVEKIDEIYDFILTKIESILRKDD